jgi:class 3 adenylate cyclase
MGPAPSTNTEGVPQTRWATTADGASIAYHELGSGPITVVSIPGWVSHLEIYWEQPRYVRFIKRLSQNTRVLVFDKRGLGMSDRIAGSPDLGVMLDDVRAVLDAAGVERAALLGWGTPGPELAAFFAATHPDRTLCLMLCGPIHYRREPDFEWGLAPERWREDVARCVQHWGTLKGGREFCSTGFVDAPLDMGLVTWAAKISRYAATPTSYEAFERMWFDTDVRPVVSSIQAPTAAFYVAGDKEDEELALGQAALIPGAETVAVPMRNEVIWVHDPEPIVAAIERFIASVRREEADLARVLATVLFTDIVGSTDRACELGDRGWAELLERHHQTLRALIGRYRGNEVKTTGDGFLATFDGPARAVKCAQGVCEAVRPLGLEVRAGCHTGEIELLGADVGGVAVHIGARVGALAGPSEVLVTSTVKDLVAGSGLAFDDRGEHHLKGIADQWHLYALVASESCGARV